MVLYDTLDSFDSIMKLKLLLMLMDVKAFSNRLNFEAIF